ncbi:holin family protein [Listeria sp. ILCC797]|uniref:phage holin family protein n=1 Tax=Listeria sp. ILCC797 TaxID=1918333 RepID=UPI000B58C415|nr:phage holin family protein [Listeria sp. ILCC797]
MDYLVQNIPQVVAFFFGGGSVLIQVLLIFTVADYVAGLLTAGFRGKLRSRVGFQGIARKLAIFILVAIAHQADLVTGNKNLVRDAVIFFYLANELISILENFVQMGVKVPRVLKSLVDIFQSNAGEKNKK